MYTSSTLCNVLWCVALFSVVGASVYIAILEPHSFLAHMLQDALSLLCPDDVSVLCKMDEEARVADLILVEPGFYSASAVTRLLHLCSIAPVIIESGDARYLNDPLL